MQRQTTLAKKADIQHKWYIVDAAGQTLGRLASEVAVVLTGKNKPIYTPTLDCGDYVIVINASKVVFSGNKLEGKFYYNNSGNYHGMRKRSAKVMVENYPVELVERTIKGMIPHTRLGRQMAKKLFVYADDKHLQQAQQPEVLVLKEGKK
ncbi:MAG: 50S ribosomal protein L13 [Bacilli bacterium]|jgi:large subunit ribosomal protein L13|nr:50S ribosomal protein L13 [Bacilli bacterium]